MGSGLVNNETKEAISALRYLSKRLKPEAESSGTEERDFRTSIPNRSNFFGYKRDFSGNSESTIQRHIAADKKATIQRKITAAPSLRVTRWSVLFVSSTSLLMARDAHSLRRADIPFAAIAARP